jgi:hypothetical protein
MAPLNPATVRQMLEDYLTLLRERAELEALLRRSAHSVG